MIDLGVVEFENVTTYVSLLLDVAFRWRPELRGIEVFVKQVAA